MKIRIVEAKRFASFSRAMFVLFLAALFASGSIRFGAQAANGSLDLTFGAGGKAITDFGGSEQGFAIAIQPDGKIIQAGSTKSSDDDFALARYLVDGTLDPSFGAGGKVITAFSSGDDQIQSLALQTDGKIIAAGQFFNFASRGFDFAIARYNPNGALDTSFGGSGKVGVDMGAPTDVANAVAFQPDGKIVVAGYVNSIVGNPPNTPNFGLIRLNSDGSLDNSFGIRGKLVTNFGGGDVARSLSIQSDGRIIAVGSRNTGPSQNDIAVARYNSNGSLDSGFGAGGTVISDFGYNEVATAAVIDFDGKLLVGCSVGIPPLSLPNYFGLVRYNMDGSLDASFGTGGLAFTPNPLVMEAFGIALIASGKIVLAGRAVDFANIFDFALARYNSDGSLDTSFGTGGMALADFAGRKDTARAVALEPDGRLVVGGDTFNDFSGPGDFALARYNLSEFDACLSDQTTGYFIQVDSSTGEYFFYACDRVKLGGRGTITRKGCYITLTHNATNGRVLVKINACTNKATATVQVFSEGRIYTIIDNYIRDSLCVCRN